MNCGCPQFISRLFPQRQNVLEERSEKRNDKILPIQPAYSPNPSGVNNEDIRSVYGTLSSNRASASKSFRIPITYTDSQKREVAKDAEQTLVYDTKTQHMYLRIMNSRHQQQALNRPADIQPILSNPTKSMNLAAGDLEQNVESTMYHGSTEQEEMHFPMSPPD